MREVQPISDLEIKLQQWGIPIQVGALVKDTGETVTFRIVKNGKSPVCSLWHSSENPTDEEIKLFVSFARSRIALTTQSDIDGFYVPNYNTIIFNKLPDAKNAQRLSSRIGSMLTHRFIRHPKENEAQEVNENIGLWSYRRTTWDGTKPWSAPQPLKDLVEGF